MRFLILFIFLTTKVFANDVSEIKNIVIHKDLKVYDNVIFLDKNDKKINIKEFNGNLLLLNFWATWCAPCREEIPAFVELQQQYRDKGLQFIGIALQEAKEVRGFLEEFNVNYPSLVGGDEVIQAAKRLGNDIGALPYTVIIDTSGEIVFTRRGPLSKTDAESVIKTLL